MLKNLFRKWFRFLFREEHPISVVPAIPDPKPTVHDYPLFVRREITKPVYQIYQLLRAEKGTVSAPVGHGKTTALLLYAYELRQYGHVGILVPYSNMVDYTRDLARSLFAGEVDFTISSNPIRLRGISYVLIDEPSLLSESKWNEVSRYIPVIKGRVSRNYGDAIYNETTTFIPKK